MLTLNKKVLNKIIVLIIFFIILLTTYVSAVVNPTKEFYVNDYAGLLNEETKNYIINTNRSLNSKCGAQIVVVTVPSLEGKSLEEYATETFRKFGIGSKEKNNGLLLLLALEERQFRVEVGYGLEGFLPDAKTGRIQDEYIIPYLKEDNWNEGIKNGFSAFLNIIAKEYNVEIDNMQEAVNAKNNKDTFFSVSANTVFSGIVIGGILGRINKNRNKTSMLLIVGIIGILYLLGISFVISASFIEFVISFILSILGIFGGYILSINGIFFFGGGRRFFWRRFWKWIFRRPEVFQVAAVHLGGRWKFKKFLKNFNNKKRTNIRNKRKNLLFLIK